MATADAAPLPAVVSAPLRSMRKSIEFAWEGHAETETESVGAPALTAVSLLETLVSSSKHPLDPAALRDARGIQFAFSQKQGLLVGSTTVTGFSLMRLPDGAGGVPRWSPPCFLHADELSLGLTFGAGQTASVALAMSARAADQLRATGHLARSTQGSPRLTVARGWTSAGSVADVVTAGVSEGLLLDLMAFEVGQLAFDGRRNAEVYGAAAAGGPPRILGGGGAPVVQPAEFNALQRKLNEIIAMAAAVEQPTTPTLD